MGFQSGTHLGNYEIGAPIGAGGMGEVYRAKDTRLNRFVAIKVLPEHVSNKPEVKARFEREAQTLASLSHPHICPVFDVGRQDGIDYLVMEYLEGQTLAERLEKGALPFDDALKVAIEIADALDKAHRQGVVHRDLKPGNIMLTKSGSKLLDFGLAKLKADPQAPGSVSNLPTNAAVTADGAILGTLQYMAPEQLEGREADARTDIFAFGAVLHEMLTGKRAFEGKSQAGLISAIMSSEPKLVSAHSVCPPTLDHFIRTCLEKDPANRWQTAHDVMVQLRWLSTSRARETAAVPTKSGILKRERAVWLLASTLLLITAAVAGLRLWRLPAPDSKEVRFTIAPPAAQTYVGTGSLAAVSNPTISPDGRLLSFVGVSPGGTQLFIRPLDSLETRLVPDTAGALAPFWSPDSRFIAFFSDGQIKKVEISGGRPQVLCEAPGAFGGTWNRDGVILFSSGTGIFRVSAQGGDSAAVTKLDTDDLSHRWPYFLPDGRHFLFSRVAKQAPGIYLGSLDSANMERLLQTDNRAIFAEPGYIVFVRADELMAQPFDVAAMKLTGEPVRITEQVEINGVNGNASFSVSDSSRLAYRAPNESGSFRMIWFERSGKQLGAVGEPGNYTVPGLSHDGRKLVIAIGNDIWISDLQRGVFSRLTFDPSVDVVPVWSPDGTRVVFRSQRSGPGDLYVKDISGAAPEELLLKSPQDKLPNDWSADGHYIMYQTTGGETRNDLGIVPVSGDRKAQPYLQGPFNDQQGRFSPDGHWVAYTSDESGRSEIYIQSFPKPGAKYQISTTGGADPRWSRDGKELFYLSAGQKLMSAAVETTAGKIQAGLPKELFPVRVSGLVDTRAHYAVSPDARRFLIVTLDEGGAVSPFTVVLNWTALLKK